MISLYYRAVKILLIAPFKNITNFGLLFNNFIYYAKNNAMFCTHETFFLFFFSSFSSPQLCNAGSRVQIHNSGASRASPQRPLPTSPLHPWAVLLWERPHRGVRANNNQSNDGNGNFAGIRSNWSVICDRLSPGRRSVMTVICWTGTAARRNVSRRWASTVTVGLSSLIQSFLIAWMFSGGFASRRCTYIEMFLVIKTTNMLSYGSTQEKAESMLSFPTQPLYS